MHARKRLPSTKRLESQTRHAIRKIVTRVVNQLERLLSFVMLEKLCKSTKGHNSVNTDTAFKVMCKDCKQCMNSNIEIDLFFCDKNPVHFWVTRIETAQSMLLSTKGTNSLCLIIQKSDLVNFVKFLLIDTC